MIWKRQITSPAEMIARTGFFVSLLSYAVFWGTDLLYPGFVSRYFSVHVFLLAGLVFGLWWAIVIKEYAERSALQSFIAVLSGIILAVLTWQMTEGLEGYRFLVTLMCFFIPPMTYSLLKK